MNKKHPLFATYGEEARNVVSDDVLQIYLDTRAIKSQQLVLEKFDVHLTEEQLMNEAMEYGWFTPCSGTPMIDDMPYSYFRDNYAFLHDVAGRPVFEEFLTYIQALVLDLGLGDKNDVDEDFYGNIDVWDDNFVNIDGIDLDGYLIKMTKDMIYDKHFI